MHRLVAFSPPAAADPPRPLRPGRRPSARTRSTTTRPSRERRRLVAPSPPPSRPFADAAASSAAPAAPGGNLDLADFVRSGADEVPSSVKQLAKLRRLPEVSATVSTLSEAVTSGCFPGRGSSSSGPGSGGTVALSDRLVRQALLRLRRSASRQRLPELRPPSRAFAFYAAPSPRGGVLLLLLPGDVGQRGCDWKVPKAISNWVEVFVGTAVREFIDKTIHINTYEQLFEGLTNPRHDAKVKELLVSVCNGAVETLVKTTHHALYNTNGNLDPSGSGSGNGVGEGRVTFETVRSFLEFVLWKLQDGARKGSDSFVDSGLRVVRYMSDKSMVIATICITLCLHVLNGTRLLVTA
ncbi:unnamed protein product [Miscanthus lutarioriparius]|uniref:Uncharacterized protein n=1 Tax=Miscanthus lutarioriparius TaxID=422564 RepID=A0A811N2B4_9POAL|nr:unnamed protein product [Miscanthus lutarioriparius]